jgi:WD40 repeat protein
MQPGEALRIFLSCARNDHVKGVDGVAVTPDGNRAVSASEDKTLTRWSLETGSLIATFHCDASVRCCACASNHRIVAGDHSGCVHFLALEQQSPLSPVPASGGSAPPAQPALKQ